jgi:signal transduction histidine kinase
VRSARLLTAVVLVAGVLALALTAAMHGRANPGLALGDTTTWAMSLQVATAVLVAATGFLVSSVPAGRSSGVLAMLAGPAVALVMVPVPAAGSAGLFTAALVGGTAAPALVGAAAATYPTYGPRRAWAWLVGIALVLSVGVEGVLRASLFHPAADGCFSCPRNLLDTGAGPDAFATVDRWAPRLTVVWSALLVAAAAARWLSAPRAVRRRTLAVVCAAAVPALSLASAVEMVITSAEPFGQFARAVWLVQCGLIVATSGLVAREAVGARAVSRRAADLALRDDIDVTALTATFVASIADEGGVDIVFPRRDEPAVDADGRTVAALRAGWGVVRVRRGGVAAAEVRYPSTSAGSAYRLVAAVRGAGLALERIGASARLQAELTNLAASRIRIIDTADAERRRLERDVHDGAQQRLIALSMLLRSAARDQHDDALTAAADNVSSALADLRRLARGIYPVTLSDMNLAVALRSLSEISAVPLNVSTELRSMPSPAVARTIYQLVARSVQEAGRTRGGSRHSVVATVSQSNGSFSVRVTADVDLSTADLIAEGSADRVEALGGTLTCSSDAGLPKIEMVLPCGS